MPALYVGPPLASLIARGLQVARLADAGLFKLSGCQPKGSNLRCLRAGSGDPIAIRSDWS
jgi:hypothetical protein